jgi:hypothetical protein
MRNYRLLHTNYVCMTLYFHHQLHEKTERFGAFKSPLQIVIIFDLKCQKFLEPPALSKKVMFHKNKLNVCVASGI